MKEHRNDIDLQSGRYGFRDSTIFAEIASEHIWITICRYSGHDEELNEIHDDGDKKINEIILREYDKYHLQDQLDAIPSVIGDYRYVLTLVRFKEDCF